MGVSELEDDDDGEAHSAFSMKELIGTIGYAERVNVGRGLVSIDGETVLARAGAFGALDVSLVVGALKMRFMKPKTMVPVQKR